MTTKVLGMRVIRLVSILCCVLCAVSAFGCDWTGQNFKEGLERTFQPWKVPGERPATVFEPAWVPVMHVEGRDVGVAMPHNPEKLGWGYRTQGTIEPNAQRGNSSCRIGKVFSREPAPRVPFVLSAVPRQYFQSDHRHFSDGKAFVCNDEVCAKLDTLLLGDKDITMEMEIGCDVDGPLSLVDVRQSAVNSAHH